MLPSSDDPERFVAGARFTTDAGRDLVALEVKPYRDRGLVVRFEGVSDRGAAEGLRGTLLTIDPTELRELDSDEFWKTDLLGLVATDPDGQVLGSVSDVELGPGQDRLVVTTTGGVEVRVPFVSAIVADPTDGQIVIDAPEGLFP